MQGTLLAIHLKRGTWDTKRPLLPRVRTVAYSKLIDALRRRRGRVQINLDDLAKELAADGDDGLSAGDIDRLIAMLGQRQREIVTLTMIEGVRAASCRKIRHERSRGTHRIAH